MKASRETVKVKTPEGEVKMAVLGDSPGLEEYLQHHNTFLRLLARKKWDEELGKLTKAVATASAPAKKLMKPPSEETESEMAQRVSRFEAAVAAQTKAQDLESTKVGLAYDLFRKTLKEDPELQWDRIVDDMGGFKGR
jgi:hypothetical protein